MITTETRRHRDHRSFYRRERVRCPLPVSQALPPPGVRADLVEMGRLLGEVGGIARPPDSRPEVGGGYSGRGMGEPGSRSITHRRDFTALFLHETKPKSELGAQF